MRIIFREIVTTILQNNTRCSPSKQVYSSVRYFKLSVFGGGGVSRRGAGVSPISGDLREEDDYNNRFTPTFEHQIYPQCINITEEHITSP